MFVWESKESKQGSSDRGSIEREREREGMNLHLNRKNKNKTSSYNNGCEQK